MFAIGFDHFSRDAQAHALAVLSVEEGSPPAEGSAPANHPLLLSKMPQRQGARCALRWQLNHKLRLMPLPLGWRGLYDEWLGTLILQTSCSPPSTGGRDE